MHAEAYDLHTEKKIYDRNRMFETLWACVPVLTRYSIKDKEKTIHTFKYTIRVIVIKNFISYKFVKSFYKLNKEFKVIHKSQKYYTQHRNFQKSLMINAVFCKLMSKNGLKF